MLTNSEYEQLLKAYKKAQNERSAKIRKYWGIAWIVTVVLILTFIFVFPNQFDSAGTAWILPVYGGILFTIASIGYFVSLKYVSQKPFYTLVYPELIEKINRDEGTFLNYEAYKKDSKELINKGGLFTKHASVSTRSYISGYTEEQLQFDMFDTTLTTSNGNSQTTHFDGIYFIVHKAPSSSVQIRSNGRPKVKGVKYEKMEFDQLKVYKIQGEKINNTDSKFYQYMLSLNHDDSIKRVYLSLVEDAIHLGIWYKKRPSKKVKKLSLNACNQYLSYFKDEINRVNEISNIDPYI